MRVWKWIRQISGLIKIQDSAQMYWLYPFAGVSYLTKFDFKMHRPLNNIDVREYNKMSYLVLRKAGKWFWIQHTTKFGRHPSTRSWVALRTDWHRHTHTHIIIIPAPPEACSVCILSCEIKEQGKKSNTSQPSHRTSSSCNRSLIGTHGQSLFAFSCSHCRFSLASEKS